MARGLVDIGLLLLLVVLLFHGEAVGAFSIFITTLLSLRCVFAFVHIILGCIIFPAGLQHYEGPLQNWLPKSLRHNLLQTIATREEMRRHIFGIPGAHEFTLCTPDGAYLNGCRLECKYVM